MSRLSMIFRVKVVLKRTVVDRVYAQAKFWSEWSGMKVIFGAFPYGSVGQPSFLLSSSQYGRNQNYKIKLPKMAFIGLETVRKQHRHNSL